MGFIVAIVGALILMSEASLEGKSPEHFWGCAIFSASLMFLYLASTLFHRCVCVVCVFLFGIDRAKRFTSERTPALSGLKIVTTLS